MKAAAILTARNEAPHISAALTRRRADRPRFRQTLLDALRGADDAGYNAVHFNEFAFIPRRGENFDRPDYRQLATRYYFYQPYYPCLQRAWKNRSELDNQSLAGHKLTGPVRQYPIDFTLRHYIMLSESHAVRKYVGRSFDPDELADGWHFDRVGLTPEDFRFPPDGAPEMRSIWHWASMTFDASAPVREHFWRWDSVRAANGD